MSTATTAPSAPEQNAARAAHGPVRTFFERNDQLGVGVALIALIALMAIIAPYFWTVQNLVEVARQVSAIAILAAGGTFVILTAGIDLSVGSALGVAAMVAIVASDQSLPAVASILLALAAGALIGAINGVFVARFALPAFIVTLAALTYLRGVVYVGTGGTTLIPAQVEYSWIGQAGVLGIPYAVIIMAIVYLAGWFLLNRTVFGRQLYAIGGNAEAARLSGIPVRRVIMATYVISGLCAGIAGLIVASRLESAVPDLGSGYELNAIAAIVLGGTSLMGGRGSLIGTLIGALFIAVLSNGMTLMNVQSFYQQIIMGVVILAAVLIDRLRRRGRTS
ncbi:ABC transporter permease subunit [Homoserinibacter sp. YIM 151385]|uniref:ABC transporter permease subunit n=1 Tax=Homoserinibacter sp. YIM 151385 TaxID=2985506 RepID=UPI0022F0C36B|nr:ribose ABC transporter permease [Homoserinibacter sp. YIM 151385]WBU39251.1 ribose ABC transporter permease [Homoserinibacter sp. YIM 151385]